MDAAVSNSKKESPTQDSGKGRNPVEKKHNKFYLTVEWKIIAGKELDEREINRVINKISDFYLDLQKRTEFGLSDFSFELDFNRELCEFNLSLYLASEFFIPTSALAPCDLDITTGPHAEADSKAQVKGDPAPALAAGPPQNTGGSGPGVRTELTSIQLAYASSPPQNTGGSGPGVR